MKQLVHLLTRVGNTGQANISLKIAHRKSANFLGVPVCKSQICTKYCPTLSQNSPKINLVREIYSIFVRRTCGSFKSTNHKKIGFANPKSAKCLSQLRKVRKCNKLIKPKNLLSCDLLNLFADRPPLLVYFKLMLCSISYVYSESSMYKWVERDVPGHF